MPMVHAWEQRCVAAVTVVREASWQEVPPTSIRPLAPDDEAEGRLWRPETGRAGAGYCDGPLVSPCPSDGGAVRCADCDTWQGRGGDSTARDPLGARRPLPSKTAQAACAARVLPCGPRGMPAWARAVQEPWEPTCGATRCVDRDSTMHILSLRRLREFWAEHPEAVASLRSWYRVAKQARWQRFTDVRAHYRSADQVGKFTVFNIAGNAYRLITVIHFNTGRVYVRRVLTHAAYNRGPWQDD